jgi:TetR/AcrR family transcriptional repressor of nem operon
MRYPEGHKEQTREQILAAAAKVFRTQGYAGGGVGPVMSAAGLTKGGFYAHFESKEDLLAQTLTRALEDTAAGWQRTLEGKSGREYIETFIARYLSPQHRDTVEQGCPLPPLISELHRSGTAPRQAFEAFLDKAADDLSPHTPEVDGQEPRDVSLAILAMMVGGLAMARSVESPAASDRILAACREFLLASLPADNSPVAD